MPSPSAASWVKFFTNADIPSPAAATYAHVFVENRIQLDMLMDLNKEYLREMGITTMGDIIAILRHAKRVAEQSAREKVLSVPENEPGVPVATVSGTPNTGTGSNVKKTEKPGTASRTVSSIGPVSTEPKPRRVLPEHEGKYKITLPTGSTARSRQILEKKEAKPTPSIDEKPTGRVGVKRSSIFDRLSSDNEPPAKFSSTTPKVEQTVSCSIFARLGGRKVDNGKDDLAVSSAGILKKSPAKLPSITADHKYNPSQQKVILVKKIPAKAVAVSSDEEAIDYYPKMSGYSVDVSLGGGLKSVSFSEEDEVLEIAPRKVRIQGQSDGAAGGVRPRFSEEPVSVKQRLGGGGMGKATVAAVNRVSSLHGTKKVVQMKHTTSPRAAKRVSPSRVSLQSDAMMQAPKQPIKNRLSLGSQGDTKSLSKRVERFSLDSKLAKVGKVAGKSNGSVFDRLGYNRK
ncbi:uncharacterized protein C19orf47 [Anopheles ziemanni]|uniref:uncharacterized protein C19orf47 n=1 Tax=Anopheles coustani TaxID=139045 RepID=UPI00265B47DC|nr:uncharacterized protein C19orf47 [Anopheles coustani]XP_058176723.1 uncharacterized protein C19orf47 [Anopheles ziemanni]